MSIGATQKPCIKWLVIDNELLLLRLMLIAFAHSHPHLRHVGAEGPTPARSRSSGIEIATRECPDVVLVDLHLLDTETPGEEPHLFHGATCIDQLSGLSPKPAIIAITAVTPDPAKAGHKDLWRRIYPKISGAILKDVDPSSLAEAMERVVAGGTYWPAGTLEKIASCLAAPDPIDLCRNLRLTEAEHRIMEALATNRETSDADIARSVGYAKTTVHDYLGYLYAKTGTSGRPQLVAWYYNNCVHKNGVPFAP